MVGQCARGHRGLNFRQSRRRSVALLQGDRAVQRHHQQGIQTPEHVVERHDPAPVGRGEAGRRGMNGGDGRLATRRRARSGFAPRRCSPGPRASGPGPPAARCRPERPPGLRKRVTGFANSEEEGVGLTDVVPFLVEDELKAKGGLYSRGPDWASHVVQDGLLITGQNPSSSVEAARALLHAVKVAA